MPERLDRVEPGPDREEYRDLLLLADEAEQQVSSYIQHGDLFVLRGDGGELLGVTLVLYEQPGEAELKAVAVDERWHGQGIGKRMLARVLTALREAGVRRVTVGTGNSGIGQLAFYQKAGFRLSHVERDFFSEARGYPAGLEENGIQLRDMVWMDHDLSV